MRNVAPSLSIITLTRNRASLLASNLASLAGQTTKRDEIIIIDNGSTDQTRQVLSVFRDKLPLKIHRIRKGKYPRLYNAGITYAKGSVIVFLDDDCVASPTFLARIRDAHRTNRNAAIQGMTYSIPKGNIYAEIMGDHYRHFLSVNTLHHKMLRIVDNKNASIRRSLILSVGGFCEEVDCGSEDIEFGIRLRSRGASIILDPSIIAFHHERTTFRDFLIQHLRFARCEAHLDKILPPNERMGLVRLAKLKLQIQSAWQRERTYIKTGQFREAMLLPVLYLTLGVIRIYGYITSS